MTLLKKHYSTTVIDEIKSLCQPLIDHLRLKHFTYTKTFHNGSSTLLTFNGDLIDRFQEAYLIGVDNKGPVIKEGFYTDEMMVSSGLVDERYFHNFTVRFNLCYQLFYYESHEDYMEQFCFSGDPANRNIYNYFYNHLDIFETYVLYFKDKARSLIDASDRNKIIIPKMDSVGGDDQERKSIQTILTAFKPNQYLINTTASEAYLSVREASILFLASRGKSIKETAAKLCLSPRTVETHLESIKRKLNCVTKSEAIDLFHASALSKNSVFNQYLY